MSIIAENEAQLQNERLTFEDQEIDSPSKES